jgi:hypothetical protein
VTGRALLLFALLAGCGGASGDRDRALAALRAGDEDAAEAAAARVGGGFGAFVRGNVAFSRSEAAEALAPDLAIAQAEDAVASWRFAAASRPDWPAARRNVERGLLRLERLREKRTGKPAPPPEPEAPEPVPEPPPPEAPEETAELEEGELAPRDVLRLLEVVTEKERQKLALRRELRHARAAEVEKDW